MSRLVAAALAASVLGVACAGADVSPNGRFTLHGTVKTVTDGDSIRVTLRNGKVEEVRLIGIDAPERDECFFAGARAIARRLATGKRVTLKGDATQATRDRFDRLLAYALLPGGVDLGYEVLARGGARVYVFARPFERLRAYREAETRGRRVTPSMWTCR